MVIAKIYVDGVKAHVTDLQEIPKGIVGAVIEVKYSTDWDGLTKTAVFTGAVTRDVLNVGNTIVIPAEVVAQSGYRVKVGFYGVDADDNPVIPSLYAELGITQDAADPSGDPSTDPELPVWAQLQQEVEELKNSGGIVGPEGPPGPQGPQGEPGNDYVITPDDYAEIAELAAEMVEVPEGGGENLVYAEEQLATGVISSDSTGQKVTGVFETGLTLGDLKQWKSFVFKLRGAANTDAGVSYLRLMNTNYVNSYNSISLVRSNATGVCAVFEWADTARTVLKLASAFAGTNSYVKDIGITFAGTESDAWRLASGETTSAIQGWVDLRNCDDEQVLAVTKSAVATDYLWEIRGLVK